MKTCQHCKYWNPRISFEDEGYYSLADMPNPEEFYNNYVERLKETYGDDDWYIKEAKKEVYWGECQLTEYEGDSNKCSEKSLAFATDGSSYYAILQTNFKFSCIQFEERK